MITGLQEVTGVMHQADAPLNRRVNNLSIVIVASENNCTIHSSLNSNLKLVNLDPSDNFCGLLDSIFNCSFDAKLVCCGRNEFTRHDCAMPACDQFVI